MKKFKVLVFLLSIATAAFGQTATEKSVVEKFQRLFNEGKYDSIFSNFSQEAKTGMPLEKTKGFLGNLSKRFGQLKNYTFLSYEQQAAQYRAQFNREEILLNISSNPKGEITGLYAKPYQPAAKLSRNLTKIALPFKGTWSVFWGGDTPDQNYHVAINFQRHAFDLLVNGSDGKSFRTDGLKNEDYYAFGQEIYAPCDGEIVMAVDGVKDNVPGKMNTMYIPGNAVLLKTENNEFILLAHFKQYSLKVKTGSRVKRGQLLGLCGNSGNSSEPHLHFHLQDDEDFARAVGIKCYFDKIKVNGAYKIEYSPVKNDKISP